MLDVPNMLSSLNKVIIITVTVVLTIELEIAD